MPYGAPQIASASADISVFTNVVSIERSRSKDADASWSCRKRAGSMLLGAAIAWPGAVYTGKVSARACSAGFAWGAEGSPGSGCVIAAGLGVVTWLLGCFRGFRVLVAWLLHAFVVGRCLPAAGGLAWVILGWCLSCPA